jgi:hypothetical protein
MTARRAGTVTVASVLATTLLVVVLGAWASSIGPGGVLRGDGPAPAGTPTTSDTSEPVQDSGSPPPEQGPTEAPPWIRVFALLVNLAVVVGAVLLAVVLVAQAGRARRLRLERRRRQQAVDEADFEVPPEEAARRAMLADAAEQRAVLLEGSPRNAVVACWHRFESQAARAGLERRPWETSSEYTMRLLDLVGAHEPAVSRLGARYREARFSEHEVTEADRDEALADLDTIHRTIGVPT